MGSRSRYLADHRDVQFCYSSLAISVAWSVNLAGSQGMHALTALPTLPHLAREFDFQFSLQHSLKPTVKPEIVINYCCPETCQRSLPRYVMHFYFHLPCLHFIGISNLWSFSRMHKLDLSPIMSISSRIRSFIHSIKSIGVPVLVYFFALEALGSILLARSLKPLAASHIQ